MFRTYLTEQFEWRRYQLILYSFGVGLFAFGARMFIDAGLGTDPLDVLVIGMDRHLGVGLGLCSSLVAGFFLTWWTVWNRRLPPLSPFVTTAAVGFALDFLGAIHVRQFTVDAIPAMPLSFGGDRHEMGRYVAVIVGLLLCSYASALIIMSGIGIRIMDLVAITMVERLGWSFFRAKMTLEVGLFTLGWLLGGPMGVTTVLFLVLVGPFIQPFMWANNACFGIPNQGIRHPPGNRTVSA